MSSEKHNAAHVPVQFEFDGDSLDVIPSGNAAHVVIRKVCDALGISFEPQLRKLKADQSATVIMMITVADDGKRREVACIDVRSMPLWLATIHTSKVKSEIRPKLIRYKRECAEVLADHFLGPRGGPLAARASGEQIAQLRREKSVLEARLELHESENSPGVIGKQRATMFLLGCLRESARMMCTALEDHSDKALRRAFKDAENQLRLHVGYPASTAQSWANLPLDRYGDAIDKAVEILARAKRDARRARAKRAASGQRPLIDIG